MKIKVLELFAGIGAVSKALERTGIEFEIVDAVEIDKYAIKSFNAVHGTNFDPQDICLWDKDIEVDLISHGSPCQDFSLSGKGEGGDIGSGTRSSLMWETIRIVKKLKPKYVIWENVKNLLSKKHRHNFDAYLDTMEQLGYTNYYQVLNAKDYGIPQNRERVFTVSIKNDICEGSFIFPKKQELKLKLRDLLEEVVDEKYYLSDAKIEMISKWKCYEKPFEKVYGNNSILGTLTTRSGAECGGLKVYSSDLEETTNLQEKCLHIRNNTKKGYLEAHEGDGVYTVTSNKRGTVQPQMIQTITTRQDLGVIVNKEDSMDNLKIRKLTPKECWRLMGFDDEDFEKAAKVNSNSQLYKQAGNSIVVNVLENIFKELFKEV